MDRLFYLVLDIGTSGVKAVLFSPKLEFFDQSRVEYPRYYPKRGWIEQHPDELFQSCIDSIKQIFLKHHIDSAQIISLGITNQRETIVMWSRKTGKALYPAIVWQDIRTKRFCETFSKEDQKFVREKTGLPIDPYFSASKIHWLNQHLKKIKQKEEICFGTVDSWVLFCLTGGSSFFIDETNASRTLLFNVKKRTWDEKLLELFSVSFEDLPIIKHSQSHFGNVHSSFFGKSIPVNAICGDQQSSLYACGDEKGITKVTFGTGTFLGQHLGFEFQRYQSFFTTMMPSKNKAQYCLEGKINRGGKEVDPLLGDEKKLRCFLKELAVDVVKLLNKLPYSPKQIFIDGGVTKDGIVKGYLEELLSVPVETLSCVNGTALGVAKLLKEAKSWK